ncbi:MAG: tRNA (adenosine(37)-N6)-dimethylallyltransferase MiaA [Bacilli bacterium]|nr:tRNA (adenosine(37)-N6)-dimethylallyltransferase MiaA [Bacilli bacterium]
MKVIVITGPTGIGKTDVSIELAKKLKGIIINVDAAQFKKDINIGTAKISEEEKLIVKHEMIDFLNINDNFNIYDFQKKIRPLIDYYLNNKIQPILVGGSGLYIKSALFDYKLCEKSRNLDFEEKYSNLTNQDLHNILAKIDQISSKKIHCNNRRRVLRALEIAESGQLLSAKTEKNKCLYDTIFINLMTDRNTLYSRINKRFDNMIKAGWIEEVSTLKNNNVNIDRLMEIGYREINKYLDNTLSFDECAEIIKQKTRNYAKRQITWIKNQLSCHNVEVNYNNIDETVSQIINIIKNNLESVQK